MKLHFRARPFFISVVGAQPKSQWTKPINFQRADRIASTHSIRIASMPPKIGRATSRQRLINETAFSGENILHFSRWRPAEVSMDKTDQFSTGRSNRLNSFHQNRLYASHVR